MRSHFRDRSRLRIPALLGGIVLLLASGVGSAGLDVCLYHGSHQHGAEHAGGEHDATHHGPGHHQSPEHDCEHHRHGTMLGSADEHEHPDHEHPDHEHPMGGEDCDFRILCVGAAGIAPLSPQLIEVGDAVATAPGFEPQVDEVELLQPTLVPHFLPFPNAPPAHS